MEIASRLGKLQSSIEKLEEEKLTRDILLQNVRMHELVSNAFSKKGIPLLVTKSQLPLINSEVSKILQGIVDFTIEMESDEDTDSLEIYINYGDSRRIIELCSGMEKTISAIALRVAMINISSLPKPDFFIIDEGFGTLDSSGVEACGRFLTSLKRYFKTVLVITHVDGIKDTADYILEITKNEKDSKVEFQ
jgi:exonuclease SbcC